MLNIDDETIRIENRLNLLLVVGLAVMSVLTMVVYVF